MRLVSCQFLQSQDVFLSLTSFRDIGEINIRKFSWGEVDLARINEVFN